jgi:hypothetical protein
MARKEVREAILSTFADFSNGMAAAWAFAAYDSLNHLAWVDLLKSLVLATISLILTVSIKLKRKKHDKHS